MTIYYPEVINYSIRMLNTQSIVNINDFHVSFSSSISSNRMEQLQYKRMQCGLISCGNVFEYNVMPRRFHFSCLMCDSNDFILRD